MVSRQWRDHGEMTELAEGARLEIVCSVKSGTEGSNPSLSARKFAGANFTFRLSLLANGKEPKANGILPLAKFMIAGSCATERYQSRQVRKEAAAVTPSVCRRVAWLSPEDFTGQILPVTIKS